MQAFPVLVKVILLVGLFAITESRQLTVNTCDRIIKHGYPCENHTVSTSDGYLLTAFRIPNSPRGNNQNVTEKPAVLLEHSLLASSDIWIFNGPDNGLPFLLADNGYDVWIANVRGTTYSGHVSLSTATEAFWNFSMDEIAQLDVPATIDYIIATTGQPSVHFAGFSQGTTVFMMLLAKLPSYNQKIRTSHLLGPGVFLCHIKSAPSIIVAHLLTQPMFGRLGTKSMTSHSITKFLRTVSRPVCQWAESICFMVLDWLTGWGSPHLNRHLAKELMNILPFDVSNRQVIQYWQHISTCQFKEYDFGYQGNMLKYQEPQAPVYNMENIQVKTPIDLYYSDNDNFVSVQDVHDLHTILGERISLNHISYPKFNHLDFVMATDVKDIINACVLDKMQKYEGRPFNGSLCNSFKSNPFEKLN